MNRDLQKLDKKITELSGRSEALQGKKSQIEERVEKIGAELPQVTADLVAADDKGLDVLALNRRRRELLEELDLEKIRVSGVQEQLNATEDQLSQAIEDRNACFSKLAGGWLKKEADAFNGLVGQLRGKTKRLFALQQLLTECGDRETFAAALGEGARYLVDLRLTTLGNGFQRSDALPDQQRAHLRPSRQLCEEIFREVSA
jgi:chromosome segregation ATPase